MGRLTGLSIKNQFSTDPTEKHIEKWLLSVLRQFYTKISPDLFEIQPDLVEIFQDLFKIRPNLIEIRSDPAKTRDFSEIWRRFLQNRNRTIPNWRTADIQPPEPLSSAAGPGLGDPIRSGRCQVGHKLDSDQPVDRPIVNVAHLKKELIHTKKKKKTL